MRCTIQSRVRSARERPVVQRGVVARNRNGAARAAHSGDREQYALTTGEGDAMRGGVVLDRRVVPHLSDRVSDRRKDGGDSVGVELIGLGDCARSLW